MAEAVPTADRLDLLEGLVAAFRDAVSLTERALIAATIRSMIDGILGDAVSDARAAGQSWLTEERLLAMTKHSMGRPVGDRSHWVWDFESGESEPSQIDEATFEATLLQFSPAEPGCALLDSDSTDA